MIKVYAIIEQQSKSLSVSKIQRLIVQMDQAMEDKSERKGKSWERSSWLGENN